MTKDTERLKDLIKLCIETFSAEKAASRIAGFIEHDRKLVKEEIDMAYMISKLKGKKI